MIDFHCHVLPGMDDGSKNVEESITMLRMLSSQGVDTVVATPHFSANDERIEKFLARREASYNKLLNAMEEGLPKIVLGAEVSYYSGIGNLSELKKLCIGETGILLLEMPFSRWTEYTVKEIIDISFAGNISVALAHVDRYFAYQNASTWAHLRHNEVLMQLNAEAFKGLFGRYKALKLVQNGTAFMLGSDAHNMKERSPHFDIATSCIRKKLGDKALETVERNGKKLLKI